MKTKWTSSVRALKTWAAIFVICLICLKFLVSLTPMPIDGIMKFSSPSAPLRKVCKTEYLGTQPNAQNVSDMRVLLLHRPLIDQAYSQIYKVATCPDSQVLAFDRARGRLGNQMFQLASLIGISARYNFYPAIVKDEFKEFFEVFKMPKGRHINPTGLNKTDALKEPDVDNYAERDISQYFQMAPFNSERNWTLDGYFQSYKYFKFASKEIRNLFNFKNGYLYEARAYMKNNKADKNVVVGIHVRRGDFLNAYHTSLGRTAVDAGYIQRAMEFYKKWYKYITFIVFSDDISWCKDNIADSDSTVLFSPYTHYGNDLALMSLCDHMIMSTGTFGWWGSWLAGGHVVYYGGYPRPGSELDKYFNKDDFFPPRWTKLM